jgi:hypothetical protein
MTSVDLFAHLFDCLLLYYLLHLSLFRFVDPGCFLSLFKHPCTTQNPSSLPPNDINQNLATQYTPIDPVISTNNNEKETLSNQTVSQTSNSSDSCQITTESRRRQRIFNEFGVPVFNKNRPLFSESIQHMHRWRNQHDSNEGGDGIAFPQSEGYNGSLGVPLDKGKERVRSNSADGNTASHSLKDVKLPRPRSWMSNLLSVGSNSGLARLANTPMVRQRYHSLDDQHGQQGDLMPVSSLVLQDDFFTDNAPRQSLGRIASASFSSPNVSSLPYLSSPELPPIPNESPYLTPIQKSPGSPYSMVKQAPLVVRNLDSAPRGSFTPSIPFPKPIGKKSTIPWNAFEQDLKGRKELIDPEEEEAMIRNAVADKRRHGGRDE